jgi:hypothetical protein
MTKKTQAVVTTTEYLKVILRAFSSCHDPEIPGVARIALLHLDVVHVQHVPRDPLHHPRMSSDHVQLLSLSPVFIDEPMHKVRYLLMRNPMEI